MWLLRRDGGGEKQMFGAKQQVPHARGTYKEAETAARCSSCGRPLRGQRCRSFTALWGVRIERKLT
jgi:hypothetical protein